MTGPFHFFGGVDFSGAKEPLSNLWSAVGLEKEGRLEIVALRPHAYRIDLGNYVAGGWRVDLAEDESRILWGVDFPFGLPDAVAERLGAGDTWSKVVAWVADRPPDEIRGSIGNDGKSGRRCDTGGALAPLDLRLYRQTVEGMRWIQELLDEGDVSVAPQLAGRDTKATLIEVYPSGAAQEIGLPRRRSPSRPGESRARAAALRTFLDFADPNLEALAVTLEDAWDATVACLVAYHCRDDLSQPFRIEGCDPEAARREGYIYRPPIALT